MCLYHKKDNEGVPEPSSKYSNIGQLEDIVELIRNLPKIEETSNNIITFNG